MLRQTNNFNLSQIFKKQKNTINRLVDYKNTYFTSELTLENNNPDPVKNYVLSHLNSQNKISVKKSGKKVTYIDLFCGGGGLSLGVHDALKQFSIEAQLLAAVDTDKVALDLTAHHFKPFVKRSSSVEDLIKYSVDLTGELNDFITQPVIEDQQLIQFKNKVDLLVGGPPCQGHSNLNNKTRRRDPRNKLYFAMPAFAIALNIPCIIIENVKSIVNASENVIDITSQILLKHGYHIDECIINASDYGVAQNRKRHFLVASKLKKPATKEALKALKLNNISFNDINMEKPTLIDFPDLLEKQADLSDINLKRIKHLHDTGKYDLQNDLRPECHQDGHTYPSVYGRINGNDPTGTITTGFSSPGRGRYIHPNEPRMINIREAARLQSFPDWYFKDINKLNIAKSHLYKIIGDAVPSMMIFPLIVSLLESFESKMELKKS